MKVVLRNLLSHKLYACINIIGLSLGLLGFLLCALFVQYELGFDRAWSDADRLYRLTPDFQDSSFGPERHPASNVAPLAPLLRQAGIEGVVAVARIGGIHTIVSRDDHAFADDNFRWADPQLFDVFNFTWLQGDPATALSAPQSVVLSASAARKYFADETVLGKTLKLENSLQVTVTGVIADLPANSNLTADLIADIDTAWKLLGFDYSNNWNFTNFHTYVRLQKGVAIAPVIARINAVTAGHHEVPILKEGKLGFSAQAIGDIHLHSQRLGEFRTPGSWSFTSAFAAIALCLLLIACANFMNLATARAAMRAREVGIRKTLGSNRLALIAQFYGEALVFTLIAFVLALLLAELLLPVFSALIERPLQMQMILSGRFLLAMLATLTLTVLIAGSYPALYLSGFQPARVLRSVVGTGGRQGFRDVLVVAQFAIAIVLIVATAVVMLQLHYVRQRDLGFRHERMLVFWGTQKEGLGSAWTALKQELLKQPFIADVTEDDMFPASAGGRRFRTGSESSNGIDMLAKRVGFGFFRTYDIPVVAGRDFDARLATDEFVSPASATMDRGRHGNYVLSESAARYLGWTPEQAIGKSLEMDFSNDFSLTVPGTVIGVVKDVHMESLREPLRPVVYFVPTPRWGNLPSFTAATVRLGNGDVAVMLATIDRLWKQFNPDIPLMRHFLDADFAALYQGEERQGQLFTLFALLTIALACLGLFGLASFTVERRCKEIGVRKVMGSSVLGIVMLLTNDFSKLVLIANVVAWPVAYYAMHSWLQNFAYRIDLTPLIFIGSGAIALAIAWATVGGTAAKAASQKPVLALRYE